MAENKSAEDHAVPPEAAKKRSPMTAAAKVMTQSIAKTAAPTESKKNATKGPTMRGRSKRG